VQLGALLTTLKKGKKATKKRAAGANDAERRDETECFRHLVLDLSPAPLEQAEGRALSVQMLPRLSNGKLLEHRDGSYRLRSSAYVAPYAANRPATITATGIPEVSRAAREYVLLPYTLGRQLYDAYDPNALSLPSSHFKRYPTALSRIFRLLP
jgi:thymidylate synthase ThyX